MNVRTLALVSALAVALPATAAAQSRAVPPQNSRSAAPQAGPRIQTQSPAYRTGFDRGEREGEQDGRRNDRFDYASSSTYRNADAGYNRNYGDRDRYRSEFRVGFEQGYRQGYSRYQTGYGGYGGYNDGTWRPGTGGPPPWANGRGRGQGNGNGSWQRNDLAFQNGFTDGYDEGLKDVRDRDQFNPSDEGRYRSGDHGYRSSYGSKDAYKARYRDAFREGYQTGYEDGMRYGNSTGYDPRYPQNDPRYEPRIDSRTGQTRPWWWPW
jgi:flagellar biosynthesis/type III secretory pathway protein FliH